MKFRRAQKVEVAAGIEREVRQPGGVDHDVVGIPERDGRKIGGEDLLDLDVVVAARGFVRGLRLAACRSASTRGLE